MSVSHIVEYVLEYMKDSSPGGFCSKGVTGLVGTFMAAVPEWITHSHAVSLFVCSILGIIISVLTIVGLVWGLIEKYNARSK